ncbi:MAG: T9SS type A sorting domain-containing protein, partial [Bacteroidota bacterium]
VAAYDFNLFSGIEDAGGMQEAASIYPNPSRNSIQFKQAPVSFNMSVCDLTGKLLAQKQMQASESYDVSTLQEGLYFIKLQTTEATQVIKFLKQ